MATTKSTPTNPDQPAIQSYVEAINEQGFCIVESALDTNQLEGIRAALAPYFVGKHGRTDFEGFHTERVYALLAKSPVFAEIVEHPVVTPIVDQFLMPSYLLWGAIAIKIHPGETPQHFHTDDESAACPRPRPPFGISVMWAIDDFTEDNGATQIIPGSHRWSDEQCQGIKKSQQHPEMQRATMKAGSAMVWAGTLVHRGGDNTSSHSRLGITIQYCQPWLRQVENMVLAVPPAKAAQYSKRIQEMLGYGLLAGSFMGYVDGLNPANLVEEAYDKSGAD